MERDPFRFVWRVAPGLNVALLALALVVGVPLLWAALDLVGVAVDALSLPRHSDRAITILRYEIPLPARIRPAPLVLLPGWAVARTDLPLVLAAAFSAVVVSAALLSGVVAALAARIDRDATDALARRMVGGVASAPVAAADDARHAALLAADAIEHGGPALGTIAATPVLVAAAIFTPILYVGLGDIESAGVLLVGLSVLSMAAARWTRAAQNRAATGRGAGPALHRALLDLARNLPAVARHGTQAFERARILAAFEHDRKAAETGALRSVRSVPALLAASLVGLLGVVAASVWAPAAEHLTPGIAASGTAAAAVAVAALAVHLRWRRDMARLRGIFGEMARVLGSLQSRRGHHAAAALPSSGPLVATAVATGGVPTGRLAGLDLAIDLPAHVALTGPRASGARTFAAALGGEVPLRAGQLTFGGVDLRDTDPGERAQRLAFAGGETYLFPGSLRANLLYGSGAEASESHLLAAVSTAGLGNLLERRGLASVVDPRREPDLAAATVAARPAIRDELAARGLSALVAPFAVELYNPNSTVGENVLFGAPIGDTFAPERLSSHPFMRGLLDAEDLSKPLAEIGAAIARNTVEMFADLDEDSALVERFALVAAGERDEIEAVLERRSAGRTGTPPARDAERLVDLAFRYCEQRHRLGLLTPEIEERLLRVRAAFAAKLPKSLEPTVEFFAADRVCAAASLRDNLLFGRIEQDRAQSEREVVDAVRAILDRLGLWADVVRLGLATRIDPADPGMEAAEAAAVEIVRGLLRSPDNLVVEHALDLLSTRDAADLVRRLSNALDGRGLLVVVPDQHAAAVARVLPATIRFESGRLVPEAEKTKSQREPAKVIG